MLAHAISETFSPTAIRNERRCVVNTSASGMRATLCRASSARKAGVSCRRRRMNRPTPTSRMLIRNGTRQPQAMNCASGILENSANMPMAARLPIGLPIWTMAPSMPRM